MPRREAGDHAVTADDLLRAEAEERFGRARAAAEAKRAADEAEAVRLRRIEAVRASLPERLGPAVLEKARRRLDAAVDAWVEACAGYDAARGELYNELTSLAPLPRGLEPNGYGYGSIVDGAETYRLAPTQSAITEAARAAIGKHYGGRQSVTLDRPPS